MIKLDTNNFHPKENNPENLLNENETEGLQWMTNHINKLDMKMFDILWETKAQTPYPLYAKTIPIKPESITANKLQ